MPPDDPTPPPVPRPPRIGGIAHVFAAAGYSAAGGRRLWAETAFRQEVAGAVAVLALLAMLEADVAQFSVALVLILVLFAVEALNSAIEVIVDHLSPDWALFAKEAKDMGSFAVLCLLLANGVHLAAVAVARLT